jgi:hypothetical protein
MAASLWCPKLLEFLVPRFLGVSRNSSADGNDPRFWILPGYAGTGEDERSFWKKIRG